MAFATTTGHSSTAEPLRATSFASSGSRYAADYDYGDTTARDYYSRPTPRIEGHGFREQAEAFMRWIYQRQADAYTQRRLRLGLVPPEKRVGRLVRASLRSMAFRTPTTSACRVATWRRWRWRGHEGARPKRRLVG